MDVPVRKEIRMMHMAIVFSIKQSCMYCCGDTIGKVAIAVLLLAPTCQVLTYDQGYSEITQAKPSYPTTGKALGQLYLK